MLLVSIIHYCLLSNNQSLLLSKHQQSVKYLKNSLKVTNAFLRLISIHLNSCVELNMVILGNQDSGQRGFIVIATRLN